MGRAMAVGKRRQLLVDGDTVAFRISSALQHTMEDLETGEVRHFAMRGEHERAVDRMLRNLMERLEGDHMRVALSCRGEANWRLKIDPQYKSNRAGSVRPLLLEGMKDYLRVKYGAESYPHLEADDVLGLWMTDPEREFETVMVGRDKDFLTVPGLHFQIGDEERDTIFRVQPEAAERWHMVQTLSGDAVDGYPGCPGIGKKRAVAAIENPRKLGASLGTVTRGPRKGETVTRWVDAGAGTLWEAVVSQYKKAGLGEAEAMKTARLARILQHGEYDPGEYAVRLWEPPL